MSAKASNPFMVESQPELTMADKKAFASSIFQLAIRLYENKNFTQALRLMDYLMRIEDPSVDRCKVTGFILQAENKCAQALEYFSMAELLGGVNDPQLNLSQAQCYILLNDYSRAQSALEKASQHLVNSAHSRNLEKIIAPLLQRVSEINQGTCPVKSH